MSKFTCALCGGKFETEWTTEEAEAEYERNFPLSSRAESSRSIVCDDCYQKVAAIIPFEDYEARHFGGGGEQE